MKGKVLGFTPATGTGAITGDDGERYSFVAAEWRSESPIAAGTKVDFEVKDSSATSIYTVAGTAADLSAITASPHAQHAKTLLFTTLAAPLALLILIACILPALTTPVRGLNLFEVGSIGNMMGLSAGDTNFSEQQAALAQQEAELQKASAMPDAGEYGLGSVSGQLDEIHKQQAQLSAEASDARLGSIVRTLSPLRYLAPLLAILLLWRAWSGAELRMPSLAAGAAAVVAFVLIYAVRWTMVGGGGLFGDAMGLVIGVGFGAWLMLLCGIGLILSGLGRISNPLATKA